MSRMNVARALGGCGLAAVIAAVVTPPANAGLFNRQSRNQRTSYVAVNTATTASMKSTAKTATTTKKALDHHSPDYPWHCDHEGPCEEAQCHKAIYWNPSLLRYVRVIYFSEQFSSWFEVDALVHPYGAVLGNSALVLVPKVGYTRGWIVAIHSMPPMNSPYSPQSESARRNDGGGNQGGGNQGGGNQGGTRAMSQPMSTPGQEAGGSIAMTSINRAVAEPQRSTTTGHVRLWTNKAGTKQVQAELLQIRSDSILVRDSSGQVFVQPFANLSDADVAFVKSGAIPMAQLAAKQN